MSKVNNEIAVQERREFGKNASRRARKAGQIPVSVYSKGKESRSFLIDADEWKVLSGHGAHMVTLLDGIFGYAPVGQVIIIIFDVYVLGVHNE